MGILEDHEPVDESDLLRCLADPHWRIFSGRLYKIVTKSGGVVPFRPNEVQRAFIAELWHRVVVLKARQRGLTTLICILWLDHALFVSDQRCAIIAQDKDTAQEIFRDKVKFAYDNLPDALRAAMPANTDKAGELLFRNNSSVRVATSRRGGTTQRLHVSEFGKICARYPLKAKEIESGAFPSVPIDGIAVVESTSEGADGAFYKMATQAQAKRDRGQPLTPRDWKFQFYAWWDAPEYWLEDHVDISEKEHDYFNKVEIEIARRIEPQRRSWYISTRDNDFAGSDETMWQEYPSTPAESFQASTEGVWYAKQLTASRKHGRIGEFPMLPGVPVSSFWDIGGGDGTGIWLAQEVQAFWRFFKYIEGWDEGYAYYAQQLQPLGCLWGTHYLPHDAGHKRQQGRGMTSPEDELKALAIGGKWKVCGVIDEKVHGIQLTRNAFPRAQFDAEGCKEGVVHLQSYRKEWDDARSCWKEHPRHDEHSEAADALRTWGQEFGSLIRVGGATRKTATIGLSKPGFKG